MQAIAQFEEMLVLQFRASTLAYSCIRVESIRVRKHNKGSFSGVSCNLKTGLCDSNFNVLNSMFEEMAVMRTLLRTAILKVAGKNCLGRTS